MSITYRGMDVSTPDVTTQQEYDAFFAFDDQPTGRPLASYALWVDLRPDVLKRLLNLVHHIHAAESFSSALPYLTVYTAGGWPEGVRYIIKLCEAGSFVSGPGFRRDVVIETLALGFYYAPTWGTVLTAQAVRDGLAEYRDPEPGASSPFPDDWHVAPDELRAGLDYSTAELTGEDLRRLRDWYVRVTGEVPKSIELYAKYRPELLKAERGRWENIVRTGLPNQMLAFCMIQHEIWRGRATAAREALLLARGLGMSKRHATDAVWYGGAFLGGLGTMSTAAEAVEEVLESW